MLHPPVRLACPLKSLIAFLCPETHNIHAQLCVQWCHAVHMLPGHNSNHAIQNHDLKMSSSLSKTWLCRTRSSGGTLIRWTHLIICDRRGTFLLLLEKHQNTQKQPVYTSPHWLINSFGFSWNYWGSHQRGNNWNHYIYYVSKIHLHSLDTLIQSGIQLRKQYQTIPEVRPQNWNHGIWTSSHLIAVTHCPHNKFTCKFLDVKNGCKIHLSSQAVKLTPLLFQ